MNNNLVEIISTETVNIKDWSISDLGFTKGVFLILF
tara:strand:- start:1805 stop:1912 length:108 start_codon:yes stop_codon:yes gene_type:complete